MADVITGTVRQGFDPRFDALVPGVGQLMRLASGCLWAEGPVYRADVDMLIWSDIPNNRMLCHHHGHTFTFRSPSNYSNGNSQDNYGRLISCEHGGRRVTRTEADGSITVLADSYKGKRLNSPNDVVVKSDGSIWFTDPSYGILTDYEGYRAEPEQDGCFVFRLDVDGTLTVVADDFVKPNGLAFSPDERYLYVADSGRSHDESAPHHLRWFEVNGNTLGKGDVLTEVSPGVPDGFRVDVAGNLWVGAGDGVHCFDADGQLLGKILVPEITANVTFGGTRNTTLFMTATTSVYAMKLAIAGAR